MKSRNKWKRFLMDDRGTLILHYQGYAANILVMQG